jgi:hypothetical protein
VIIGPVKANSVSTVGGRSMPTPQLLEIGGASTISERSGDGGKTWVRSDGRRSVRKWEKVRTRRAYYAKRPFMKPALDREAGKTAEILARLWRRRAA